MFALSETFPKFPKVVKIFFRNFRKISETVYFFRKRPPCVSERTLFALFKNKSFISSNVPHPKTKNQNLKRPKEQRPDGRDSGEEDATEPPGVVHVRWVVAQIRREQAAAAPGPAPKHGAGAPTVPNLSSVFR